MFFVSVWCCLNGICVLMPVKTPSVYSFIFVLYLQPRPRDRNRDPKQKSKRHSCFPFCSSVFLKFLFVCFSPSCGMETAARFSALARRDLPLVEYAWEFCGLATTTALDDATINSLFWIGANYHHPVDLPDTSGLSWREGILRCLESVQPRSRTSPPVTAFSRPPSAPKSMLTPFAAKSSLPFAAHPSSPQSAAQSSPPFAAQSSPLPFAAHPSPTVRGEVKTAAVHGEVKPAAIHGSLNATIRGEDKPTSGRPCSPGITSGLWGYVLEPSSSTAPSRARFSQAPSSVCSSRARSSSARFSSGGPFLQCPLLQSPFLQCLLL